MNGLTQSTTAKILALNPETELDVLRIIDAALTEAVKPYAAEAESCKQIVNETNERTAAALQKSADELSARMEEIIGLRGQLESARSDLADGRSKIASLASQVGSLQSEVAQLKLPPEKEA